MGMTGVQENGHGEMGMSDFPLGSKNKYKRMDSVFTDDDDQYQLEKRKKSTRKYVLVVLFLLHLTMSSLVMM